ncbi:BTB/POZ domain-containing protein 3-like protein [Aphelenchoides avenae]|nr:BTB/POZ domain-containing protein 3-like protein [Aphelenchus avenae]
MPVTLIAEIADFPFNVSSVLLMPELSDVQIRVVDNENEPKLFHARKLVLAVASDVFKTMFFGSVPQENPVVIKDSNPATFEAFLRLSLSGGEPFIRLHGHDDDHLVKVVMKHLEGSITSENVGQIVLNAQSFVNDALPKFWESVEVHGEALLKSDEFPQLRKDTVQSLVQRKLEAAESLVYESALTWAKAECARCQRPTDGETLRNSLEGILQHVRFPAMTAEEFARGKGASSAIFAAAIPQSIFPDTPRFAAESYVCERLAPRNSMWCLKGSTEAIDFSVSRAVSVTGFGSCRFYYGDYEYDDEYPASYSIASKLAFGSLVLATKRFTGTIRHLIDSVNITFDKPIEVDATKRYTATVVVTGTQTYYGYNGISGKTVHTKKGDVVFTFMQSDVSAHTTVAQGMIPRIAFRV